MNYSTARRLCMSSRLTYSLNQTIQSHISLNNELLSPIRSSQITIPANSELVQNTSELTDTEKYIDEILARTLATNIMDSMQICVGDMSWSVKMLPTGCVVTNTLTTTTTRAQSRL